MFRFRLRTLMAVLTLLAFAAAILGWWLHSNRMREEAREKIKEVGGQFIKEKKTDRVKRVYLEGKAFDDQTMQQLIPLLKYLPSLNELDLVRNGITDKSVEPISQLKQLKEIYIFETGISTKGIEKLRRLSPGVAVKVEKPEPVATKMVAMNIYRHAITALVGSPNGRQVATGNGAGQVMLWDLHKPKPVGSWQAHEEWVFDIDYSADESMIATGGDHVVKLWSRCDMSLIHQFVGPQNDVHDVAFTPDGKHLIAASDDRRIWIWDLKSKQLVRTLTGHQRQIPRIALSSDGDLLASASRDHTVRLWSIPSGDTVSVLSGHQSDVMSVAFNPPGKIVASGDQEGVVRLHEVATHELIREFKSSLGSVFDLAFDPRGELLVASGVNGIQAWNLESGLPHSASNQQFVSRLLYNGSKATDKFLLATNIEGELRMLDVDSLETIRVRYTMHGRRGLE